ncbi:DUF2840 domain-containing protein [Sphingopyxis indica]|uniref:Glycosidase n=1 Tax=Sphingopyxis indica TaxID=436663 RepID=A0A239L1C4_9SPHN|nr:DUF2840 domain-containing protein [Sphingopyxis indica]SNT24105.1 Protein of unknown function [Sphingopyxis indica]
MSTVSRPDFTRVELLWIKQRIEHWIRFGRIAEDQILDRRRRRVFFAPNSIFAFVRWASNDFGTAISRIDILRAVTPGEPYQTVPGVDPGGDILLRVHGWPKVQRVFESIDSIDALNIDPVDASPDYWRHVHNRLAVHDRPSSYTAERHHAWLIRRKLQS